MNSQFLSFIVLALSVLLFIAALVQYLKVRRDVRKNFPDMDRIKTKIRDIEKKTARNTNIMPKTGKTVFTRYKPESETGKD